MIAIFALLIGRSLGRYLNPVNPYLPFVFLIIRFLGGFSAPLSSGHHLDKNDPQEGFLLKEYALSLRLLEQKAQIADIPSVLVSRIQPALNLSFPEVREMICEYLARSGAHVPSARETQWGTNFQWSHGDRDPSLAIIIPSKTTPAYCGPWSSRYSGITIIKR